MRRIPEAQARSRGAGLLAAALVLLLGLAASATAARLVAAGGDRARMLGADRYADQATVAVATEMRRYQDSVLAAAASLSAQEDLTAGDFDTVTRPLMEARLAGASGLGFAVPATTAQVPAVQRAWRAQGVPGLVLKPAVGQAEHALIIFFRPLDGAPNPALIGADMTTSPQLWYAMKQSGIRDGVSLSDSYLLIKDRGLPAAQQKLSFALAAPVTRPIGTGAGPGARGWVVMGLRGQDLLRRTLDAATQGQANVTLTAPAGVGAPPAVVARLTNGPAGDAALLRTIDVPVADRHWTMTIQSTDAAAARDGGGPQALGLFVAGAVLSLLAALVVYLLLSARGRALNAVEAATRELRAAERAAGEQAALLGAVMDSLGDGVGAVDEHGAFFLHNPAARQLLGVADDVDDPDRWAEYYQLHRPDGEPFPTDELPLVRALRGHPSSGVEMVVRRRDREVPISVSARPLDPKAGRPGAVAVFHDLTGTRDLQRALAERARQLEDANAELREANSELEAFSHTVSHDLRAPLRAIGAFSTLLLKEHAGALPPEARHFLGRIGENSVEMTTLIHDLMEFSRVLRSPLAKTPTPLAECVAAAWSDVAEGRADDAPALATLHTLDLPTLPVDARLLKQVFVNLLTNAAKFAAPDRAAEVTVSAGPDPAGSAEPAITVRDNGIGFEPGQAERIFGVFQRLHPGGEYEGTGIGLSIVQRIVARHGGRAWAEGLPGEGAAFSFTLGPDTRPVQVPRSRRGAGSGVPIA